MAIKNECFNYYYFCEHVKKKYCVGNTILSCKFKVLLIEKKKELFSICPLLGKTHFSVLN